METAANCADLGKAAVTHLILISLGVLIVVLAVVSALGILPSLRIVPDNTHFDFTQFRRISFPVSATLSILAITLFFTHGLNFGIDFKGGTLMEVRAKSGAADIGSMRSTLSTLGLGDIQMQQFGGPDEVLIRVAEQPGGDAAQQEAVQKVRKALGDAVEYRRVEVVGPRVSSELLAYGMVGLMLAIEGLAMAAFTEPMRKRMAEVSRLESRRLRWMGVLAAALGVAVVWAVRTLLA